jgi:hypothetical protein
MAYDRKTHALIRDVSRASCSSQSAGLHKSRRLGGRLFRPAGSGKQGVELVATKTGGQFEVMFRAYGPEKAFFDKTGKLPDIEKVK